MLHKIAQGDPAKRIVSLRCPSCNYGGPPPPVYLGCLESGVPRTPIYPAILLELYGIYPCICGTVMDMKVVDEPGGLPVWWFDALEQYRNEIGFIVKDV